MCLGPGLCIPECLSLSVSVTLALALSRSLLILLHLNLPMIAFGSTFCNSLPFVYIELERFSHIRKPQGWGA